MEDLIKTFHIDWHLLVAQSINFLIVLLVLAFFALKPLTKMMREREERIAQSIKDAEIIDERLKEIADDREKEIGKGRAEAQKILVNTEKEMETLRAEKKAEIKKELDKLLLVAKNQVKEEKRKMMKEIKEELGEILELALHKVTAEAIDEKTHKKLIEKAIEDLKSHEK
jgi:F-type H+-transporting ATPase subunit b